MYPLGKNVARLCTTIEFILNERPEGRKDLLHCIMSFDIA